MSVPIKGSLLIATGDGKYAVCPPGYANQVLMVDNTAPYAIKYVDAPVTSSGGSSGGSFSSYSQQSGTGITGSTGAQGIQGIQGATGSIGSTGSQGIQG